MHFTEFLTFRAEWWGSKWGLRNDCPTPIGRVFFIAAPSFFPRSALTSSHNNSIHHFIRHSIPHSIPYLMSQSILHAISFHFNSKLQKSESFHKIFWGSILCLFTPLKPLQCAKRWIVSLIVPFQDRVVRQAHGSWKSNTQVYIKSYFLHHNCRTKKKEKGGVHTTEKTSGKV